MLIRLPSMWNGRDSSPSTHREAVVAVEVVVWVCGGGLFYPAALPSSGSLDESHNTNWLCDFQFVRDSAAAAEAGTSLARAHKRKMIIYGRHARFYCRASAKWRLLWKTAVRACMRACMHACVRGFERNTSTL